MDAIKLPSGATFFETPAARQISSCRICGSGQLTEFWDGGPMRIVEFPPIGEAPKKPRVPLRLAVCENCWLVQLMHTTPAAYLYDEFWYRSGTNEQMRKDLRYLAAQAVISALLKPGDWVLDIGCNDGTLLESYPCREQLNLVGIDPAKNLGINPQGWTFVNDYFSAVNVLKASGATKYRAITCAAMFYDLDDPIDFTQQMAECLAEDGVLLVQMNYLGRMLELCAVDNVVHEHLTYFSLDALKRVFREAGLSIFHAELNKVNGGSICVWACHQSQKKKESHFVENLRRKEFEWDKLHSMVTYDNFAKRIERTVKTLNRWIDQVYKECHKAYAYGASTRGMTLLQLLDTEGKLVACAERNPEKFGRYMAGGNLRICSEEEFRKEANVGLLLPYHFVDSIYAREAEWLEKGGLLMVPLPQPRILEWSPYGASGAVVL